MEKQMYTMPPVIATLKVTTDPTSIKSWSFKTKLFNKFPLVKACMLLVLLTVAGVSNAQFQNCGTGTMTGAIWSPSAAFTSCPTGTNAYSSANTAVFCTASGSATFASMTMGNIKVTDNFTIAAAGTMTAAGTGITLDVAAGKTLTWTSQNWSTASANAATITKTGLGTWNFAAQGNATTGTLTLTDGTLFGTGTNSFGGPTATFVMNGGTVYCTGGKTRVLPLKIGGDVTLGGTGTDIWSGTVLLTGASQKTISDSLTSGGREFTGLVSGTGGLRFISAFGGGVGNGGTLNFQNVGNSFTGGIRIESVGALAGVQIPEIGFADGTSLGDAANTIVLNGGRITSMDATSAAVTNASWASTHGIQVGNVAGTSISVKGATGVLTINGVISDLAGSTPGSWSKQGAGTIILTGVSTYTGATNINNARIQLRVGSDRLPTATTLNLGQASSTNLGIFDMNGFSQHVGGINSVVNTAVGPAKDSIINSAGGSSTITLDGSGTYSYGVAGTATNSGVISGPVSLVVSLTGSGAQTLGDNNDYSGTTTVNSGTLTIANPSGTGIVSTSTVNGGTLTIANTGGTGTTGGVTVAGGTLLVKNTAGAGVSGNVIVTSGTLAGTGTITGATTTIAGPSLAGTVSPGNSANAVGKLTTGNITVADNTVYQFDITALTGTEGINWDNLTSTGTITFSGTGQKVMLTGSPAGWNNFSTYHWRLFTGTVSGSVASWTVDYSGFTPGAGAVSAGGSFIVEPVAGGIQVTYVSPNPSLTPSPASLNNFVSTSGVPSASQSFSLSGLNLDGTNLTIAAPVSGDFQISLDNASWTTGTISLSSPHTGADYTYNFPTLSTTVYVRLNSTGNHVSGNIVFNGAGLTAPINYGVTGDVVADAPSSQSNNIVFSNVTTTSFQIDWTTGNCGAGSCADLVVIRATSATGVDPTNATSYASSLVYGSGSVTGAGNYVIYDGDHPSPITVTGLSPCTNYTVQVYKYDSTYAGTSKNYLTTTTSGNPASQTTAAATINTVTAQAAANNGVSGQVSVSWTNPVGCFDDIMIVATPTSTGFTAATPSGNAYVYNTNSYTDGSNSAFDGGKVVYKGTTSPQIITNLANGVNYTFKIFTRFGTTWSTTGVTASATPYATLTFTEVILPQFIEGVNGTNSNRIPYAYRATLGGLSANTTYNYNNAVVLSTDGASSNGAGNCIFPSSGAWVHSTGPSLASAGNYGTFTTDGSGNYTGWFITEPTGNATRFVPGVHVYMRILVNDGGSGTVVGGIGTSTNFATVLQCTTGAANGTAIRSTSSAQPKDFVCLYDNTAGTGRPLAATFVESDAVAENTGNSFSAFYGNSVDGVAGAWGTIIPNTNAAGVRRIESRKYSDGSVLCSSTDADGTWPTGSINTVSPNGGTTELVIAGADAPLNCSVLTLDNVGIAQVADGNIGAGTNDNLIANFRVNVVNGPTTLSDLQFAIGGTFNAGDVNNFNLYTSTSNSFPGGTPLKTVAAGGIGNTGTIDFSGLAQSLTVGNHYYWITADLSVAGIGNTVIVPVLVTGDFTFGATATVSSNTIAVGGTETIIVATPTISLASGTVSAGNIVQNTTNNVLYRADVTVGVISTQLNDVQFTTGGSYAASDLVNLKLWYSSSNTFSTGTSNLISTLTTSLGTVTHDFGSLLQNFPVGTNYLYVTADLACANITDQINVLGFVASDFTFSAGSPTGSGSNSGLQSVTEATPANATGASALGSNTTVTVTWTAPSCYTEVMIVAKATAFTGATPTGNGSLYPFSSTSFTDGANGTFDGGVVVFKGTVSPQIITGLTNNTSYNFKIYSRNGTAWSAGVVVSATPSLTFNPGDIQIVGMNASTTDNFSFVTWTPIPAGTVIKFTDCGFINNGQAGTAANNFRGTEGQISWTAPAGGLAIGDVVRITSNGLAGAQVATRGTATALDANFALSTSGDQLFVFTGADKPAGNPSTFTGNLIYGTTWGPAAGTGGAWLTSGAASAALSYLPTELNGATSNMAFSGQPNADYPNSLRNNQLTFPPYKAAVANPANFVGSSGAITVSSTNFTLFVPGLTISEIMYDSPGNDEEWIEIYNGGTSNIDLQNYQVTNTIPAWTYTFPSSFVMVPGQYMTLQVGTFGAFPFTPDFARPVATDQLSNTGSTLSIVDPTAVTVNTVTYNNSVLTAAAGNGASLEVTDVTNTNQNFPTNWQASAIAGGSPGTINSTGVTTIYSRGSGLANTAAIWSSLPNGLPQTLASLGGFASNRNVVIQTGHTVQITSGFNVKDLTVQSGAKLWRNSSLVSSLNYISVYGSTVQLDGTVGNGTTFDAIGLNIEGASVIIQGNSGNNVSFARIRKSKNDNNTTNLVIDRNVRLTYVGTALYSNQGSSGTFNVTVNAGSTVDMNGTGHLSVDGADGRNSSTRFGTFTINGTINKVDTVWALTDNPAGTTAIIVGNGGTLGANTVIHATALNAALFNAGTGGVNTGNMTFTVQAGGNLDVYKALEMQSGAFTPAGTVTLKSTSVSSIGILNTFSANFSGTYTGQMTAERFYASSITLNQHMMGSPISNVPLSQFGASGGSGYIIPTPTCDETKSAVLSPYGTVFSLDETKGATCGLAQWKVESSGNAINGHGYSILKNGSGTVSLTGTPNQGGTYTISGLTNSTWSNTSLQGRAMHSGWNLLTNPYPAYISAATLKADNLTNFDNEILVWQANGGGAGAYLIATTVAPFQAFLVHIKNGTPSASYVINAGTRTTATTTFYRDDNATELTITATNTASGLTDETRVGFNPEATTGFDSKLDVDKLPGALIRHTLYTGTIDRWMAVNTLPSIEETNSVPMGMEPGVSGTYTLTFDGINSFDATSYITLEDKQLNVFHDVRSGAYTFTAKVSDNWNRFVLHFTPAAVINTTSATCTEPGMINISQDGAANWTYDLTDANNSTIATGTLNATAQVSTSLQAGVYTLTLVDAKGYTVVKNLNVDGPQPVAASFVTPKTSVEQNTDVVFTSTSANAGDNFWNFGDGGIATGSTATHRYMDEGTYNVTLTATNVSGCSSTANQTISVTKSVATGVGNVTEKGIKIWSAENKVNINFPNAVNQASIFIYDILGQELVNDKMSTGNLYSKSINNIEAGYVIVKVKSGDETTTRKVFITNN